MLGTSFRLSVLLIVCGFTLSGCQGFLSQLENDFNQSFGKTFAALAKKQENPEQDDQLEKTILNEVKTCPEARIIDDLRILREYTDNAKPSPDTLISSAIMDISHKSCVYNKEHNSVVLQLTVSISGELGKRARIFKGDKPNFSYPYFVGVTDKYDNIVAKEIFAAPVEYASTQSTIVHEELVRQIIYLESLEDGSDYSVLVGFQLTEDQLEHNRILQEKIGNGAWQEVQKNASKAEDKKQQYNVKPKNYSVPKKGVSMVYPSPAIPLYSKPEFRPESPVELKNEVKATPKVDETPKSAPVPEVSAETIEKEVSKEMPDVPKMPDIPEEMQEIEVIEESETELKSKENTVNDVPLIVDDITSE